jgi:hypothetical protein
VVRILERYSGSNTGTCKVVRILCVERWCCSVGFLQDSTEPKLIFVVEKNLLDGVVVVVVVVVVIVRNLFFPLPIVVILSLDAYFVSL